jgi:outer membrane protein
VGILNSSQIYLDQKDKTMILPIINYKKNNFYIKAIELGYKYNDTFSLIAQPKLNSVEIEGIKDRKSTFEAGFKVSYPINKYKFTFKTLFDTLGVHNGYTSSLMLSRTFSKMPFIFIPNIGIEYQSKQASDYYFGIDENESFETYTLNSTINKSIGFVSIFNINKKYDLTLIYNYKKLDKDIENSPIVTKDNKRLTILSLVYKF